MPAAYAISCSEARATPRWWKTSSAACMRRSRVSCAWALVLRMVDCNTNQRDSIHAFMDVCIQRKLQGFPLNSGANIHSCMYDVRLQYLSSGRVMCMARPVFSLSRHAESRQADEHPSFKTTGAGRAGGGRCLHAGHVQQEHRCGKRRATTTRSEERRVGKECRSRWSPYH